MKTQLAHRTATTVAASLAATAALLLAAPASAAAQPVLPASSASSASDSAAATIAAACPGAAAQLQDLLASAVRQVDRAGEVQVRFEVDGQGRVQAVAVSGHRGYAARARTALQSLQCQRGQPQGYRLTIRFDPDTPGRAASAAQVAATVLPTR